MNNDKILPFFIAIDVETTGVDINKDKIIEIG
ncbi:MAG: 3'-5' exonuclease, partial [Nitrospirae bacterium]|nr:3'-5' exonuclease [Nitrospirota bacterium]